MTPPRPDDLPPEMLAGYADGELGPADRARVEDWLADHPGDWDSLDAQSFFSPLNGDLWEAVRPPALLPGDWRKTLAGIDRAARPSSLLLRGLGTAVALAAAVVVLAVGLDDPPCRPPCERIDMPCHSAADDSEEAPFAIAKAEEIEIFSMPESAAGAIVVGLPPLGDSLLLLARPSEVVFHSVGPDSAGRFPDVPTDVNAAPMIWAPAPRAP